MNNQHASAGTSSEQPIKVLIYSDDSTTREKVVLALGRRVAADLPPIKTFEYATPAAVVSAVDKGGFDILILDGEATPAGGMGVCRQLKDEIYQCPPVLVLTGRPQDGWLATWSRAEAWTPHPIDPVALADSVAELVRARLAKRVAA
jgi:DNA-binding response OmpR family regulator